MKKMNASSPTAEAFRAIRIYRLGLTTFAFGKGFLA
jgi:hypothetical protein